MAASATVAAPHPIPLTPSGVPDLSAELKARLAQANARVFAYSDFVKQVACWQCGAQKQLPSKTAYIYCDHCGALTDYDYRMANFNSHAALTNTVFVYLTAPIQPAVDIAVATGNKDRYRQLMRPAYAEWIRQCPLANSPRCANDAEFFGRQLTYQLEGSLARDFDKSTHSVGQQLTAATMALQKIRQPDGSFLVGDGIWQVAALFKQQMEMSYQVLQDNGIMELDPEGAPVSVWLKMEFTIFCQNWLPSVPKADSERLLAFFGLNGEYTKVKVVDAETKKCGGCGDELKTVPGAQQVICESCGRKLDIAGGEVPCQNCGAPLSFPVGTSAITCPYCHANTHRV
jgi:LSD1 subclass zinc finger protein